MKKLVSRCVRVPLIGFIFTLMLSSVTPGGVSACTIYDMPEIRRQLVQSPQPLPGNMKRFLPDEIQPMTDREPDVTDHIRAVILDAVNGNMRSEDYDAELWKKISPARKEIQADLERYGDLVSITLINRRIEQERRNYLYRVEFKKMICLMRYILDEQNKITFIKSEGAELKPGADVR